MKTPSKAARAAWQPNYVDLGDERTVKFGGQCVVCGARYATPGEELSMTLPGSVETGPPRPSEIDEIRYARFVAFDEAFRGLGTVCPRCHRTTCPDCWDQDAGLCGACVAEQGLARSPGQGAPISGPLADGRLARVEPGRYSAASRPPWLSELLGGQALDGQALDSQAAPGTMRDTAPPTRPPPMDPAVGRPTLDVRDDDGGHAGRRAGGAPGRTGTTVPRAVHLLERLLGALLVVGLPLLFALIVAAEVSPQADAAIRQVIHVDVRQLVGSVVDALARLRAAVLH